MLSQKLNLTSNVRSNKKLHSLLKKPMSLIATFGVWFDPKKGLINLALRDPQDLQKCIDTKRQLFKVSGAKFMSLFQNNNATYIYSKFSKN